MKTVFENPGSSYISCIYTMSSVEISVIEAKFSAKIWPVDVYKKQSMIDLDIAK